MPISEYYIKKTSKIKEIKKRIIGKSPSMMQRTKNIFTENLISTKESILNFKKDEILGFESHNDEKINFNSVDNNEDKHHIIIDNCNDKSNDVIIDINNDRINSNFYIDFSASANDDNIHNKLNTNNDNGENDDDDDNNGNNDIDKKKKKNYNNNDNNDNNNNNNMIL